MPAGHWLHLDYTYNDLSYQETGSATTTTQKTQLSGARGDLGLNLLGFLAISAGGEYQDGHFQFDGTPFTADAQKTTTSSYIRDLRAFVHLIRGPVILSAGLGDRYWYNHLENSYRQRTEYTYHPILLTYFLRSIYIQVEQDLWTRGTSAVSLSDVSSSHKDVNFALGKGGSGLGVELGMYIPGMFFSTHIYASYHKWNVKASDTQNDGVKDLSIPDNNTTILQGGIGISF